MPKKSPQEILCDLYHGNTNHISNENLTDLPFFCRVDFQVYLVLISDCNSLVYSLLSECPVTCDLGLSSVYLGLAESSFGLTLPIFPTIIFYLCFNLCLTLCFTYFTYVLTYVKLCLTYASTRHMKLTCFVIFWK